MRTPNPKNYYPGFVGTMRIGNGTPEGLSALGKSLERTNNLDKFSKGFQNAADIVSTVGMLTYKAKNVHKACDQARLRIMELNLPLVAFITGHNTFSVKQS